LDGLAGILSVPAQSPDGSIVSYAWNFGDATSGRGSTVRLWSHTYPKVGSYTVTLIVNDNAGAGVVSSKTFNRISVSARGYKHNGAQKVDLCWNGASGTSFEVYRNGTRLANLQAFSYTTPSPARAASRVRSVSPSSPSAPTRRRSASDVRLRSKQTSCGATEDSRASEPWRLGCVLNAIAAPRTASV
jgi:PKD repeat protein